MAFHKSKKIMSQRLNFTQNISTALIKNHDLVVAENLSSRNMMRNHALAMRIQDVGWRQLLGQLQYKSVMYNRKFVMVNPKLTTQTCSDCGFVWPRENRLTLRDREWTCPECGSFHIRDHNAAINILNKGLK
jgi:putative transposase